MTVKSSKEITISGVKKSEVEESKHRSLTQAFRNGSRCVQDKIEQQLQLHSKHHLNLQEDDLKEQVDFELQPVL